MYSNSILTPAEIFGATLDKDYTFLIRFNSLLKEVDFKSQPPFDLIYSIFNHCVTVHRRWTLDLLIYHLGGDAKRLQSYITLIDASRDVDVEYVVEHLLHYKTRVVLDNFVDDLHRSNGNITDVLKTYSAKLNSLLLSSSQKIELVTGKELLNENESTTEVSSGGCRKVLPLDLGFDDCLSGGVRGGEILVIIGPTGAGKSTLMLYECLNAVQYGLKAVYVSLELSTDLIAEKIRRHCKMRPQMTQYLDRLHVVKFPTKSTTLEEVFTIVDQLCVDVIAIDYLDILSYTSKDAIWLTLEDMTAKFRGLCEERNIVGITVSQATRSAVGSSNNKIVDLDDVAFSIGKVFTADFVVTLTPPNLISGQTTGLLFLAKNRRGPKWLQTVKIDYENVIIYPVTNVDYTSFKLNLSTDPK